MGIKVFNFVLFVWPGFVTESTWWMPSTWILSTSNIKIRDVFWTTGWVDESLTHIYLHKIFAQDTEFLLFIFFFTVLNHPQLAF